MIWKSFGCHWLTSLHSDRAISTDPCLASKEVTKMISKWSNRFMADCKSHQSNPQIPKKMEKFKNKMLTHLRSQAGYAMSKRIIVLLEKFHIRFLYPYIRENAWLKRMNSQSQNAAKLWLNLMNFHLNTNLVLVLILWSIQQKKVIRISYLLQVPVQTGIPIKFRGVKKSKISNFLIKTLSKPVKCFFVEWVPGATSVKISRLVIRGNRIPHFIKSKLYPLIQRSLLMLILMICSILSVISTRG